jgi:hypothetical protein
MEAAGTPTSIDRRAFLAKTAAAVGALGATVLTGGTVSILMAPSAWAAPRRRAFMFRHGPSTQIVIHRGADPHRLDIRVRHQGKAVERFKSADPQRLRELDSEHFTVRYIRAPSA